MIETLRKSYSYLTRKEIFILYRVIMGIESLDSLAYNLSMNHTPMTLTEWYHVCDALENIMV